jgi:TolB-like protein/tetratricopeptide (TPR) repeat protein
LSIFQELKRRNVFRIGIAYVVLSWMMLQVTDVVVPILALPDWVARLVLFLLVIGFPFALFFAWVYELTPEGLKRERDVDRSQSITGQTGRKLDRVIIGVLVIAVALLLLERFTGAASDDTVTPPPQAAASESLHTGPDASQQEAPGNDKSVAVLPFVNMSDDEQNEYFSDGISEELLNVLVRIEGLRVPSRTSSFTFKDSALKVSEIGRELGVDNVLEGSVRKAGNRIRVTAQLIDVDTDTHLWSETYTRELDDIFAVQDEIAHAIVNALKVTLSGREEQALDQRPTDNVEAYNQYLYGRHWWNQRIPGRMGEAIEPLRKAVELDPEFVQAWAALADVYLLLPEYNEGSVAENIPQALEASQKALALDPDSAQALTTSAYIKAMHYYQWEEAEAEFKRAIELNPNYRTAHQWYAEMLAVLRRTDEAMAQLEKAAEVDPLAAIIPHIQGWVLLHAGRLQEAKQSYLNALRLDPGLPYAIGNLGWTHLRLGEFEQARARFREVAELLDEDPGKDLILVDAMENPAFRDEAMRTLGEVPIPSQPFDVPVAFMMLGEPDLALERLERNFEAGGPYAPHINRIVLFDPLRDDPRFRAMLEKMNLWP